MPSIVGINKTALWSTWKTIRAEIRNGTVRDVIDFLDYDVDPDVWIERLLEQIATGKYEPATPFRFTIGKSNGFSRTMTQPAIPDLVLYRPIVDILYRKAIRREHSHVYFKRERLQQAQTAAQQQATQQVQWAGLYRMCGLIAAIAALSPASARRIRVKISGISRFCRALLGRVNFRTSFSSPR